MSAKTVYRMSSAGKCPKALSAERLGYSPTPAPSWLETAANEGKLHEDWIVQTLETQSYNIGGRQAEMILDYPQFKLVGHIDGVAIKDNRQYLLEIKTMSQFEFQRWQKEAFLGFSTYADQISLYFQALKKDMSLAGILYVVKNRSSGYIDQWIMPQAPSDFELVIQKLIAVEKSVAEDNLYEASYNPSSLECKRCFFDNLCIDTKELLPATALILSTAVTQCRKGKVLMNEGDALYKEGKQTLENHCKAVSPDKKYTFEHDKMVVPRFHVERVSYPRENIENAFSEDIFKPLQKVSKYWQCTPRDLAKDYEENGE